MIISEINLNEKKIYLNFKIGMFLNYVVHMLYDFSNYQRLG